MKMIPMKLLVETEEFSSSSEDSLDTILSSDEESETVNISNEKSTSYFYLCWSKNSRYAR